MGWDKAIGRKRPATNKTIPHDWRIARKRDIRQLVYLRGAPLYIDGWTIERKLQDPPTSQESNAI